MQHIQTDLVVVGAGPGGYTAAFYAADKGKKVILVEQDKRLGGVCLNCGCIPSKALLHSTALLAEARNSHVRGMTFSEPSINLEAMRHWKESILERLGKGISDLGHMRRVDVMYGRAHFEDSGTLRVETSEGQKFIRYEHAIVAVGSKPALPSAFDLGNKRIMTSTEALELEDIPKRFLIVGGGYIGMELGMVYATLGSEVVLAEAMDSILLGVDADLVRPIMRTAQRSFKEIRLGARVLKMETRRKQLKVAMEVAGEKKEELYDRVLVAVGRVPNCDDLGLENTKISRDDKGFIQVDLQQQTQDPAIFAIGDAVGGVLLAHKASKEARIAVEVIAGEPSAFKDVVIPAVVFTNPEVAWCGLTEAEAKSRDLNVQVARYPWGASGRALTLDRPDGMTKLIIEPETERILGVGIVGAGAGELIGEGVVAIELGATAKDLAESVHPHPTLSETLMECAEVFYGHATHAAPRRRS